MPFHYLNCLIYFHSSFDFFFHSSQKLLFSLYLHLFMFNPSFVRSQAWYVTPLLGSFSFVFLSHLTNLRLTLVFKVYAGLHVRISSILP